MSFFKLCLGIVHILLSISYGNESCAYFDHLPVNVCLKVGWGEQSRQLTCDSGSFYETSYYDTTDCTGETLTRIRRHEYVRAFDSEGKPYDIGCDCTNPQSICEFWAGKTYSNDDCTGDYTITFQILNQCIRASSSIYFKNTLQGSDTITTTYYNNGNCEGDSSYSPVTVDWKKKLFESLGGCVESCVSESCNFNTLLPTPAITESPQAAYTSQPTRYPSKSPILPTTAHPTVDITTQITKRNDNCGKVTPGAYCCPINVCLPQLIGDRKGSVQWTCDVDTNRFYATTFYDTLDCTGYTSIRTDEYPCDDGLIQGAGNRCDCSAQQQPVCDYWAAKQYSSNDCTGAYQTYTLTLNKCLHFKQYSQINTLTASNTITSSVWSNLDCSGDPISTYSQNYKTVLSQGGQCSAGGCTSDGSGDMPKCNFNTFITTPDPTVSPSTLPSMQPTTYEPTTEQKYWSVPCGTVSSWDEAKTYCKNNGGKLATFSSLNDVQLIKKQCDHSQHGVAECDLCYTGWSDSDLDGQYTFVDGKQVDHNIVQWAVNEPHDDAESNCGCIAMTYLSSLVTIYDCHCQYNPMGIVCERVEPTSHPSSMPTKSPITTNEPSLNPSISPITSAPTPIPTTANPTSQPK
eukprot:22499_1